MRDASPAFRILLVLVLAGLAVVPLVAGTFYLQLLTKIMILAIFAMSLDLLVGFTGLVSTRPNGAGLPAAAHDPALAVRPGACRHPRQRAAHARARLPDLPLQACRLRRRRRSRRARRLPPCCAIRLCQPRDPQLAPVARAAGHRRPRRDGDVARPGDRRLRVGAAAGLHFGSDDALAVADGPLRDRRRIGSAGRDCWTAARLAVQRR